MWILDLLWWGIGYAVARLILPLVTFGKVQAEPLESAGHEFGWLGYRRKSGGLEVQSTVAAGIELVTCCLGLAAALYFIH